MVINRPFVYTVHETARALGKTEAAIRNLVARERLPVLRMGGHVFVPREALDMFVRGRRVA